MKITETVTETEKSDSEKSDSVKTYKNITEKYVKKENQSSFT